MASVAGLLGSVAGVVASAAGALESSLGVVAVGAVAVGAVAVDGVVVVAAGAAAAAGAESRTECACGPLAPAVLLWTGPAGTYEAGVCPEGIAEGDGPDCD